MRDLISRKKIRDYIKGEINHYGKPFEGTAYELGLKIMRYIDGMDSEYDIDKVVDEFDKKYNNSLWIKGDEEFSITRNELIEIVNQFGISDYVCEWKQDNMFETIYRVCDGFYTTVYQKDFEFCPYCEKKR